ncbi:unnamed protein product [Paramecium octaurelia]|uniref:WD40-repeat-containing domain n=1 Tax=Paramecium octaurelia TaxID=43137 RepID=A0A8S1TMF6_PAROT|nr:unnamed protein product [Paramecium octaurelia]
MSRIQTKMLEKQEEFVCAYNHNEPIIIVALDLSLPKNKKFYCSKCLQFMQQNHQQKIQVFSIIASLIEETQKNKAKSIEESLEFNRKKVEQLQFWISDLKSCVIKSLNQIDNFVNKWIQDLNQKEPQYIEYSFHAELDEYIKNDSKLDFNQNTYTSQISKIHYNWYSKTQPLMVKFKEFKEFDRCQQILFDLIQNNNESEDIKIIEQPYKSQDLQSCTQSSTLAQSQSQEQSQEQSQSQVQSQSQEQSCAQTSTQAQSQQQQQQQQQTQQQQQSQIQNTVEQTKQIREVQLTLIDQSTTQLKPSQTMAFNNSGSIMISTEYSLIKVWAFNKGKIQLLTCLQGHTNYINCLIYSKRQNSFISSSDDKTIRCWQSFTQQHWSSSQPYNQHTNYVQCLILNENEDLLFSGSFDNSIKVWNVDFNNNCLIYQYSLNKHTHSVNGLSLSPSEQVLVSCANESNSIIIWEKNVNNIFEFKYIVKQSIYEKGNKIMFISNEEFIWATASKTSDYLYAFQLKEGVFEENLENTVELTPNNKVADEFRFPILYNKEKNLIILRVKSIVYILEYLNNGKYRIATQLDFHTFDIYGQVTNNWQYLVCWDQNTKRYSTYELQIK